MVSIETYPELLIHLNFLLDRVNPLAPLLIDTTSDNYKQFKVNVWPAEPFSSIQHRKYHLMSKYIENNSLLLSILCLIRNLSFDRTNEQYLAYSFSMIRHLLSLLLISYDLLTECTRYVFDILSNIARRIDVTASLRCKTDFFLEDCHELKSKYVLYNLIGPLIYCFFIFY